MSEVLSIYPNGYPSEAWLNTAPLDDIVMTGKRMDCGNCSLRDGCDGSHCQFAAENVDVQKVRKLVENGLAEALDGVQHLADLMSYLVEAAVAPRAPEGRLVAVMESEI